VNLLLDSHVLLWFLADDKKLSKTVRDLIEMDTNGVHCSIASLWEIAIKRGTGKLAAPNLEPALSAYGFNILPVTTRHTEAVVDLPRFHGDPFDRMLVVQAKLEGLILVSADQNIRRYDVPIAW